MPLLHEKLRKIVPTYRDQLKDLAKTNGEYVVGQVTIGQLLGGQRGINALLCDTSTVPPEKGMIIRNHPVMELAECLPEEVYWLLLTGEMPNSAETRDLQIDLERRSKLPGYVWKIFESLPKDSHPMAVFNTLILAMERESVFRKRYDEGMKRDEQWEAMLEDSLNLVSVVPQLAAAVYRWRYDLGPRIEPEPGLDWAAQYARLMGLPNSTGGLAKLMRLYMVLHSDHESGNVSAHASHCVGSALSDAYYAVSAGLNGLAGPLHGLANQECLEWLQMVLKKFNGNPTNEQLNAFARETLDSGRVIPGYGHAVLRVVDPRFIAFRKFGENECPDSPIFKLAVQVFDVVPPILQTIHKIKDPWPNVDAISGSLIYHYGVTQHKYYTVMFGVSRVLGLTSQLVMSRAWNEPIERPKSVTTDQIRKLAQEN